MNTKLTIGILALALLFSGQAAHAQTAPVSLCPDGSVKVYRGVQFAYQTKYTSQSVPGVTVHQLNGYRHFSFSNGQLSYEGWQNLPSPLLTREITQSEPIDGWLPSVNGVQTGVSLQQWPLYADELSRINGNEATLLATARQYREAKGEAFSLSFGGFASGIWGPSTWTAIIGSLNDWTRLSLLRPSQQDAANGVTYGCASGTPSALPPPPPPAPPPPPPAAPPRNCAPGDLYSGMTGQRCPGTSLNTTGTPYSPYSPPAGATAWQFRVGDYVETKTSTTVRSDAGANATPLTTYPAGVRGTVVGQELTGAWFEVNFTAPTGGTLVGWVSASSIGGADINSPAGVASPPLTGGPDPIPPPPPSAPAKFQAGDMMQTMVNLNARSAANGSILGVQNAGSRGTIMPLPPVTTGGYTWWNVDYVNAPDGWSAENYLIKITDTTPDGSLSLPSMEYMLANTGTAVIGGPLGSFLKKDIQYLPSDPSEWRFLGTRAETAVDPSFPGTVAVRYWNLYVQPSTGKFWRVLFLTWSAWGSGPASNPVPTNWRDLPFYIEVNEAARRAPGSLGTGQWDKQPILWDASQLRNTAQYKLYMMAPETLIVSDGWRVDTLALIKSIEANGSPNVQQLPDSDIASETPAVWQKELLAKILAEYAR